MLSLSILMMSFSSDHPRKKKSKHEITSQNKPTCSCGQVTGVSATNSGGYVTVTFNTVSGGQSYSVGGYYGNGARFMFCASGSPYTFLAQYPTGTLQVTANCDNTVCTSATCSGLPSSAATF